MYYHIGEADGLTRFGSWSCRVNVFILGGRGRGKRGFIGLKVQILCPSPDRTLGFS